MHVRIATFYVKQDQIDEFIRVTLENQRNSRQEPGALTFDFHQGADDPSRFVLYEVFKDDDAFAYHTTTDHFKKWFSVVPAMFVKSRDLALYRGVGEG